MSLTSRFCKKSTRLFTFLSESGVFRVHGGGVPLQETTLGIQSPALSSQWVLLPKKGGSKEEKGGGQRGRSGVGGHTWLAKLKGMTG